MKIKDRVLRLHTTGFAGVVFYFLNVHKGYHFILFIRRRLGMKYGDDITLITRKFRRFSCLSLFIEQRFEFIYEIIFVRFS